MIFYFSATGNCKYVAEQIANVTKDECYSIVENGIFKKSTSYTIKKNEMVGIISPTYAWGIPSIIIDFLEATKFNFTKKPYFYFIATYGTTPAHSGYFANKYLNKHANIEFDAYYSVKMPDTWTPIFNLSDKEKVEKINSEVSPQLTTIMRQIFKKSSGNFMKNKVPHFTAPIYEPYYEYIRKTKNFRVENTCIGCGLCSERCPVNAIKIKDGKPIWTKSKCAMCLGCLHHCPKFSIQYGSKTKGHGQYTNPNVKI